MRELHIDPDLEKCLPPLTEEKYEDLKSSIAKDGYDPEHPIVLWAGRDGVIVDGHHRYRACLELDVEPALVERSFASLDEAVLYTLGRYMAQRELTAGQRILAVTQMMTIEDRLRLAEEAKKALDRGRDTKGHFVPSDTDHNVETRKCPEPDVCVADSDHTSKPKRVTREVAKIVASRAKASRNTVYEVKAAKDKGVPEVAHYIASGELSAVYANEFVQNTDGELQAKIVLGGLDAIIARVHQIEAEKENFANKIKEVKRVDAKVHENVEVFRDFVKEQYGDAKTFCVRGAMSEMWCPDCNWGFDVYTRPVVCCPYCSGVHVERRAHDWWPDKPVRCENADEL